jgi:hypothetical protein
MRGGDESGGEERVVERGSKGKDVPRTSDVERSMTLTTRT